MIVYKVVKAEDMNNFKSSIAIGKACINYPLGKMVSAPEFLQKKGYHIMVFHAQKLAEQFMENTMYRTGAVLECEAFNKKPLKRMLNLSALSLGDILFEKSDKYFPIGTFTYEKIKPLRVVAIFAGRIWCQTPW